MKVRLGFVSNSSSSSFLIYGSLIEEDNSIFDIKEFADDPMCYCEQHDLECHSPWDSEYYVGKSWDGIKDNQTGKEFKEEVEETIKEMNSAINTFGTFSEAWRDG